MCRSRHRAAGDLAGRAALDPRRLPHYRVGRAAFGGQRGNDRRRYGIGAFVLQAGNLMQTDQLLAGVVILSLFGLAVGQLINWLETRLLHWR